MAGIRTGGGRDWLPIPAERAGRARRRREIFVRGETPAVPLSAGARVSDEYSTSEVARRVGVTPATPRRWQKAGVIPQADGNGTWSPAARAQARIVARLRERGHSLAAIRTAT